MTERRLVVRFNRNVEMSPGKLAAQVAHAVLYAHGIPHEGMPIVVLKASKTTVEAMDNQVHDAGHTELPAGTLTCAAEFEDIEMTEEA